MPAENHSDEVRSSNENDGETVVAGTPVVVRRHAGLAAFIGAAASAVAIAYLWRASQTMLMLDWSLCAVMTVLAAMYLSTLVDARTPLLVADDLGVRIRLGNEWRGLPWDAINQVVVHPRRGLFRDGRIVFSPRSLTRALEGLDGKGRRQAALNQKMYGAALAVPLGITTRVSTSAEQSIADEIGALALGRAEVFEVAPEPVEDSPAPTEDVAAPAPEPTDDVDVALEEADVADETPAMRAPRRTLLGGIGTVVSRVAKGRRNDIDEHGPSAGGELAAEVVDGATVDGGDASGIAAEAAVPLRPTRRALRAEVTRETPATPGNVVLEQFEEDSRGLVSEARELHRPGSVDLVFDRVRPISTLGDPVEPLVIDDFVTEPAYDPVIGPELAAARTRLGLSVDELADRTRIRPHVIESIEVDDFAPCGGDFYARGHLRTLARVLGKDSAPLLESFEKRYATAPINARRVFEAELATGMTGSMRSTIGGPNWGLLIGVVLSLVLVWGVVRLFSGEPAELVQNPAPVLNGSAGIDSAYPAGRKVAPVVEPLPITLTAAQGDTTVIVRDGEGRVVFSGEMVLGERKRLEVAPPVRVRAADAGMIEVSVKGRDRGVLGEIGEPARRTFG
jgi:hypothetical protein